MLPAIVSPARRTRSAIPCGGSRSWALPTSPNSSMPALDPRKQQEQTRSALKAARFQSGLVAKLIAEIEGDMACLSATANVAIVLKRRPMQCTLGMWLGDPPPAAALGHGTQDIAAAALYPWPSHHCAGERKPQCSTDEPPALTSSNAHGLCVEAAAAHGLVCRASLRHAPARGPGTAARGCARAAQAAIRSTHRAAPECRYGVAAQAGARKRRGWRLSPPRGS